MDSWGGEAWQLLVTLYRIAVAYLLAFPIGWNRESRARSAGLRTFPLVAAGACGYMTLGLEVFPPDATEARARVVYGVITGIGFVGGGAILKSGGRVSGTATAASIWNTGALGVACGWERFDVAAALAILNYVTLSFLGPVKQRLHPDTDEQPASEAGHDRPSDAGAPERAAGTGRSGA